MSDLARILGAIRRRRDDVDEPEDAPDPNPSDDDEDEDAEPWFSFGLHGGLETKGGPVTSRPAHQAVRTAGEDAKRGRRA